MHPHTHAVAVIPLKALGSQFKPFGQLTYSTPELMHNWASPTTKKEVFTTPESMPLCLGRLSCYEISSTVLSQATLKKREVSQFRQIQVDSLTKKRKWSPVQRPVVQQVDRRQGETWKCQLLDFAWTNYQVEFCKFRVRSTVPISYVPREVFPQAHVILSNPTWVTHLLRLVLTYRILMWNASVVQKHFSCTWQEGLVRSERKFLRRQLEE